MTAMLSGLAPAATPIVARSAPTSAGDAAPFAAVLDAVAAPAAAVVVPGGSGAAQAAGTGAAEDAPAADVLTGPGTPTGDTLPHRPGGPRSRPGVDDAALPSSPSNEPVALPGAAAIGVPVLPAQPPPPGAVGAVGAGAVGALPAAATASKAVDPVGSGSVAPSLSAGRGVSNVGRPVVRPDEHGGSNSELVDCTHIRVQNTRPEKWTDSLRPDVSAATATTATAATGAAAAFTDASAAASASTATDVLAAAGVAGASTPVHPLTSTAAAAATATAPVAAAPPVVPDAPQPGLASALAQLRRGPDGIHELEVTLHPADLGAVQVKVTMHHGALDVTVACAHAAAREAVTAALPALHRELVGLGTVDVTTPRPTHDSRADTGAGARDGGRSDAGEQDSPRERRRPASDSDSFDRWM